MEDVNQLRVHIVIATVITKNIIKTKNLVEDI